MTSTPTVVVSQLPAQLEPVASLLAGSGCEVRRLPADPGFCWTDDTIAEHAACADALVGIFGQAPLSARVLDGASRLRVVTSPIIGTETIDVEACTRRGIVVAFGATPENQVGMAEAVVMLVAALRKRLVPKMHAVADGSWRPATGVGGLVRGSVVGLVGFGAIGRATAARLNGWQCRLVVHDPYVDTADIEAAGADAVSLPELLSVADVVTLNVTLTAETTGLIGSDELASMRPGACLVNTSRGGVVDEDALLAALDSGHLGGAAIDTWQHEGPGTASPLRSHPMVIATGHSVGHSAELYASHPVAARDNTLRALGGRLPLYVRNPEVGAAWTERVARLDRAHPLAVPDPPTPQESP